MDRYACMYLALPFLYAFPGINNNTKAYLSQQRNQFLRQHYFVQYVQFKKDVRLFMTRGRTLWAEEKSKDRKGWLRDGELSICQEMQAQVHVS